MKKYILSIFIIISGLVSFAQDINLTDSVIYFDNKPVAYYVKELNQSNPHYDIYIISLDMKLLIAAKVVKFDAPVRELKPFYYYDIIFEDEKDTFSIYHEGQSFVQEIASLIKKYNLLQDNKISKNSWRKFKKEFNGNNLLKAKINEFETYLIENRYFNEQTERDRTKPVIIKDDKFLFQDGKKIGLVVTYTDVSGGGENLRNTYKQVMTASGNYALVIAPEVALRPAATPAKYTQILLPSDRVVDASKVIFENRSRRNKNYTLLTLFNISLPLLKESRNEDFLWYVCQLVENYLL